MKVLLLNSSDVTGGAAKAAYRTQRGLRLAAVDSTMRVQEKLGDDETVLGPVGPREKYAGKLRAFLNEIPLRSYPDRGAPFSASRFGSKFANWIEAKRPDIVNLHWGTNGFIDARYLRRVGRDPYPPLVWTLHDCWSFTGGCHYPGDCVQYRGGCGSCPVLGSRKANDLSRKTYRDKERAWRDINLHFITPSEWLGRLVQDAPLTGRFPVKTIPNGVDTETYRPRDRNAMRGLFRLPVDRRLVLFGSVDALSDRRKGFDLLQEALERLQAKSPDVVPELVVFGNRKSGPERLAGFKVHYIGRLGDEISLAALYAACDLLVLPSREDNLPNVVLEAMSCGLPVVAFDTGGIPEMVRPEKTGLLAKAFDSEELAEHIRRLVAQDDPRSAMGRKAREVIEAEYTLERVGNAYRSYFLEIIDSNRTTKTKSQ